MSGLTIIVATADTERFRAAMTLATAQAALGGRVRVYCHERSVALLRPAPDEDAAALAASGLPDRPALLAMAIDGGVALIACQTGLALTGLEIDELTDGVEAGGMVGLLASLGDDRLTSI
jgi:predicted peroxiredoxin